jgi:hypothetical protein
MATLTLERVLTEAESLSVDERTMLEELLRKRRIEGWRRETATEARRASRAVRSGKCRAADVEAVIGRLRDGLRQGE